MSFALQFDGVNDYVSVSQTTSFFNGTTSDAYIEFSLKNTGSTGFLRVYGDGVAGTQDRILINTNGTEFRYYRGGGVSTWTGLSFDMDAAFVKFKVATVTASTNKELFINDVSQGVQTSSFQTLQTGTVLGVNFNTYSDFQLKYFRFVDNLDSSNDQYYDAENTSAGSVLPETTPNFSDGTLINFPTDDNQWINLGGGGFQPAWAILANQLIW